MRFKLDFTLGPLFAGEFPGVVGHAGRAGPAMRSPLSVMLLDSISTLVFFSFNGKRFFLFVGRSEKIRDSF